MGYSTEREVLLKNALEQIAKLESDLSIEKVLYASMKDILKRREEEIVGLYNIVNELMSSVKP